MESWVKLARATAAAEFPNFELSQAFNVFDVTQSSPPANAGEYLERRAQSASVCDVELKRQWEDVYPRAALGACGSSVRT